MRCATLVTAVVAIVSALASPARADCSSAFESAQRQRRDSHLQDAERFAVTCAGSSCPAWMQKECSAWVDELRKTIPSVVVRAVGEDGCDLAGARFSIDGQAEATVDGRSVRIDPGIHVIRIRAAGHPDAEQRVVLAEGERDRTVFVSYAPTGQTCGKRRVTQTDPDPGDTQSGFSPLVIGVGGVGIVATGLGAALQISSLSRKPEFERCAPSCDADEVSRWRTTWTVGDILLAAGIASLGVAAYLYFTGLSADNKHALTPPLMLSF